MLELIELKTYNWCDTGVSNQRSGNLRDNILGKLILLYDICGFYISFILCFKIYFMAFNLAWLHFIIQITTQHRHFDLTNREQFLIEQFYLCLNNVSQRFITFF